MNIVRYVAVWLVLLIFFVFGVAASVTTAQRIAKVIRLKRFPLWDGRIISFGDAPISAGFYLIRLGLMLLTAVGCVLMPIVFVLNSL